MLANSAGLGIAALDQVRSTEYDALEPRSARRIGDTYGPQQFSVELMPTEARSTDLVERQHPGASGS